MRTKYPIYFITFFPYLKLRYYGPLMLSHLFANWNLKFASWPYKGNSGGRQATFVLEKENNT